jgi:hypothetical protein
VKAAEALLPHLQNPILVISLLSPILSKQYIKTIVQTFLKQYHYQNTGICVFFMFSIFPDNSETANIAERNAFLLHTPLNETVVPLLEKYLELLIKDEQNFIDEPGFSLFTNISQYNKDQVHSLTRYLPRALR